MELRMGKEEENKTEDAQTTDDGELTLAQLRKKSKNEQQENVEDVKNLRKVIKLNAPDEQTSEEQQEPPTEIKIKREEPQEATDEQEPKKVQADKKPVEKENHESNKQEPLPNQDSKDSLDQKRLILQSIKDFDFQIKKNQSDIEKTKQKIDSLAKDLDDLISLYEIVSEQMNPFVGLSKVTKKRLDSLENITSEINDIYRRIENLENSNLLTVNKTQEVGFQTTQEIQDDDLNEILEISLNEILINEKIDNAIDRYIENLNMNV
jgi:flagellar protein FlaC